MNAREFYNLVVRLRKAQIDFNKYPYPHLKEETAKYEAMVDAEIERVEKILRQQADKQQQKLLYYE
jgi:hypothetical protein